MRKRAHPFGIPALVPHTGRPWPGCGRRTSCPPQKNMEAVTGNRIPSTNRYLIQQNALILYFNPQAQRIRPGGQQATVGVGLFSAR